MRSWFYRGPHDAPTSLGLLFVRIVMGVAMMLHGWYKIEKGTFDWMGANPPFPRVLVGAAAIAEFGGGLFLIIGLLTPVAALFIGVTMAVAAGMVHIPKGDRFVASGPGETPWELAGVYFALSLMFLLAGPGMLSLDALIFGRRSKPPA